MTQQRANELADEYFRDADMSDPEQRRWGKEEYVRMLLEEYENTARRPGDKSESEEEREETALDSVHEFFNESWDNRE